MRLRGFELVSVDKRLDVAPAIMPKRGTKTSAGYDFATPVKFKIASHGKVTIWTDIKAYMQEGEVLTLHIRSSIGTKKGLRLANITGIVDSDYYNNPDNDGNIGLTFYNDSNDAVTIEAGERVAQGIFLPFLIADNGNTDNERIGGFGSTGKA
ncbi:MAG TPA: dUTP diphosphatase [Clostridium sp.]|uniref:dUTP diphosphatase n=1 Tax=Clostridium sp. TaxID=1506 RepID=UPI002F93C5B3